MCSGASLEAIKDSYPEDYEKFQEVSHYLSAYNSLIQLKGLGFSIDIDEFEHDEIEAFVIIQEVMDRSKRAKNGKATGI